MKGTAAPFLVTVKDLVGSFSSRIVPYLRILTDSEPVFVTEAVNLRSSTEETEAEGAETLTDSPSALLKGVANTLAVRARQTKEAGKNMVAEADVKTDNSLTKHDFRSGLYTLSMHKSMCVRAVFRATIHSKV